MRWTEHRIVFPEGDEQEIEGPLSVLTLVDVNGLPVRLPLSSPRQLVYRVVGMRTRQTNNGEVHYYLLEQLGLEELRDLSL